MARGSYISTLQAKHKVAMEGLDSLLTYVQSEKFKNDTTVQVADIILRIQEIKNAEASAKAQEKEPKTMAALGAQVMNTIVVPEVQATA